MHQEEAAEIEAIANNKAAPTFENTIVAMERSGQLLDRVQSVFSPALADVLLGGHQPREAIVEIVQFVRFLAGDDTIVIDERVARSETETG